MTLHKISRFQRVILKRALLFLRFYSISSTRADRNLEPKFADPIPLRALSHEKGTNSKRTSLRTNPLPVLTLHKNSNSLFIAFHGSWNRSDPTGYKVVRLGLSQEGEITSQEDFISGWLQPDGSVSGRPVDLEVSPAGDLYLSDDKRGMVSRISGE